MPVFRLREATLVLVLRNASVAEGRWEEIMLKRKGSNEMLTQSRVISL
jgi:hypothetical protein